MRTRPGSSWWATMELESPILGSWEFVIESKQTGGFEPGESRRRDPQMCCASQMARKSGRTQAWENQARHPTMHQTLHWVTQ